jgi:hypothetical protein
LVEGDSKKKKAPVIKRKLKPPPPPESESDVSECESESDVSDSSITKPKRKNVNTAPKEEVPQMDTPQMDTPQMDTPQMDTPQMDTPQMDISEYNELSFVVRGDTRPNANDLRRLGGRYNHHLKDCPGWIFSKKHRERVEKYITAKNNGVDAEYLLPPVPQNPVPHSIPQSRPPPPRKGLQPPPRYQGPPAAPYNPYKPQYPLLYEKGLQQAVLDSSLYTALLIWFQTGGEADGPNGIHQYVNTMLERVYDHVRADL